MIRRWQGRVAAAERARFGTGLYGRIRRLFVRRGPVWPIGPKTAVVMYAWRLLPRRVALVALAALSAYLLTLTVIVLAITFLVLQAI